MAARIVPTTEQKQVLDAEPAAVFVVNAQGSPTHVVLPIDDARRLFDEYIRRELQVSFDQVGRGEVASLDIQATIAEARRRYSERNAK